MFGIDSGEILIIAVVALVVIGPKDLPRVMRTVGSFVGRARGMAKHFRSGLDTMMREAELEEMEKKWQADNERIMREQPLVAPTVAVTEQSDWGAAAPAGNGSAETSRPKPKAPPRTKTETAAAPARGPSDPPAPPAGNPT